MFGERLSVCLSGELRCSRPQAQAGGRCRKEAILGTQPAEITLVRLLSWVPWPDIAQGLQRQGNTILFVLEVCRICLRQREIPGFHKFIFYVWEINKNRACVRKVLECPKEVTWSHKHKINNKICEGDLGGVITGHSVLVNFSESDSTISYPFHQVKKHGLSFDGWLLLFGAIWLIFKESICRLSVKMAY